MVKSNALRNMLELLNDSHLLKSWTIYNDRFNGDLVVKIIYMTGAECVETGSSSVTYKHKSPQQAARDQLRADKYKHMRKAKQTEDTTPFIGKSSLRNYQHGDIEVNRDSYDLSPVPNQMDTSVVITTPHVTPEPPSSPMPTPEQPLSNELTPERRPPLVFTHKQTLYPKINKWINSQRV